MTDALAEALEQKKRLYSRLKEVRLLVNEARDPGERFRQSERLRILREMYRDACDQAEALRPPEEKRRKKPPRRAVQTGAVGFDFFERCGTVWADLEGRTWGEFQELANAGSARQAGFLLQALRSAMGTLTENQLECVMAYYARKRSTVDIAQERGVNKSTVSRTLKRALGRLERCILASLKARECVSEAGFDFLAFAGDTEVLTERQWGLSARRAAEELGLTEGTVRRYWRRYEGIELAGMAPPEEYVPTPRRRKDVDLRRLLSGGGTVGDCVDAETYRRMMAVSTKTERG